MSKRRHSSVGQNEKQIGKLRGESGYRLCRWCAKEVQPPRRTFCSDNCIHEWKIRSNVGYMRELVYERDLGRCNLCKADTRLQKIQLEDLFRACGRNVKDEQYRNMLASLRLTPSEARKSLWQADHILPVAFGGGECGLENIQTICTKCHKLKTTIQAGVGAKPKKIKPMKMQGLPGLDGFKGLKGFSGKIDD